MKRQAHRKLYIIKIIYFYILRLIKSSENDSSNKNIILTSDYFEKYEKSNKLLKKLEEKCIYLLNI